MGCPVCENSESTVTSASNGCYEVKCELCGDFLISHEAKINARNISTEDRWRISAWICQNLGGNTLISELLDQAENAKPPGVIQRAHRMLSWIVKRFPAGKTFDLTELGKATQSHAPAFEGSVVVFPGRAELVSSNLVPVGWNRDLDEMSYMVAKVLCDELGWLARQKNGDYQVAPKGLLHLEKAPASDSATVFCAMWFHEEMDMLWVNVIEPAIREAGYEPLRMDGKQHNEKIDDEIVASIRVARFVVADFTGHRGGVYYEAGFAHGVGLPVIFMCREDDSENLHFDVRQYNCITWRAEGLDRARQDLRYRIEATVGRGPLKR